MQEDDYQLFMLLVRNPKSWTVPEVEHICQSFIRLLEDDNLPLSPLLTTRLWRYWFLVHGETPLMDEPKHNLALMLAAQAFGEFVPTPESTDFFGQYRKALASEEASLTKEELLWGPRACFDHPDPALDSSVSHVCVLREKGQIQEVTLIGQNTPGIRQELFDAFFYCALRMQSGALDWVNPGAFQLSSLTNEQEILDLPGLAGNASFSTRTNDLSAADLLGELVRQCKSLQEHTEFVSVSECDVNGKRAFYQELRSQAQSCFQTKATRIIALDPNRSPEWKGMITYVPYYLIGSRPRPLRLVLPLEIIQLTSFDELLEEFKFHTVERIIADANVRLKSYEKHILDLQAELRRWNETPENLHEGIWGSSVTVTEKLILETGTTVRLEHPEQIPIDTYMSENVPTLIRYYQSWAERMKKIIKETRSASEGADNPARRLAISLFIDMALRDRTNYFQDKKLRDSFDKWHNKVGPFLMYKWRTSLRSKGIDINDIFNRNTIFHTRLQMDEDGNLIALVVQPFATIAPTGSILVLDPQSSVMRVFNSLNFSQAIESITDPIAEDHWKSFESLFMNTDLNQPAQEAKLQKLMGAYAVELLPPLVKLIASDRQNDSGNFANQDQIGRTIEDLIEKNRLSAFISVLPALLLGQGAYQSARELCRNITVPSDLKVRILLWQTLTECLARGYSPTELIPNLLNQSRHQGAIRSEDNLIFMLLDNALKLNSSYVKEWISKFQNAKDLRPVIGFLMQQWPKTDAYLTSPEKTALWKATTAVEMLRLSRKLNQASREVSDDKENMITLLAKLGQPLEEIVSSEMSLTALSDIYALMEILLGREKSDKGMGAEA